MLNLLKDELYDNFPRLYDRAVNQWVKVVGGMCVLVADSVFIRGAAETHDGSIAAIAGGFAVVGAGFMGYGLGQLSETSRAFDEAMATKDAP